MWLRQPHCKHRADGSRKTLTSLPWPTRSPSGGWFAALSPPAKILRGITGLVNALERADILILDWELRQENRGTTMGLLRTILSGDRGERLRLIAIYTGEPGLQRIRDEIMEGLKDLGKPGWSDEPSQQDCEIPFGPCRIVLYAKSGTPTPGLEARSVKEADLPDRLAADFATMVDGLLPCLVLSALTAVRENVYQVLERFDAGLDPALLAHRACLSPPSDSTQHMVEQITSELHGIMDDAVLDDKPADIDAIKEWLHKKANGGKFTFGDKELSTSETVKLLHKGLGEKHGTLALSYYDKLSSGFALGGATGNDLDGCLASKMCFRTVVGRGTRTLWMGTVVRQQCGKAESNRLLVCITPRCDSVRLSGASQFLFLPLVEPRRGLLQLVLPPDGVEKAYKRVAVDPKPELWVRATFKASPKTGSVTAQDTSNGHEGKGQDSRFVFLATDPRDVEYHWVGELKGEVAQSVAQEVANRLSRIAMNQCEWLRRKGMERIKTCCCDGSCS